MEQARTLGQALVAATMEGRGFVSEASRAAQAADRRPVVLLAGGAAALYASAPRGTNALVPPDAPLAPAVASAEGREVEKCVRQLLVALVSNLCHRIWSPAALQESAWRVPDGRRLEDFVPPTAVPVVTATAAAALPAPPAPRAGSTDWMDAYAALARAPFTAFLSAVIKGAPVSFSTIVLCHLQLEAAAAAGLLTPEVLGPIPPRLLVLAYLSLAAKYTLDTPGTCRSWGRIGGVPPTVLAEAELAVLRSRKFALFVAPADLVVYLHQLARAADRMSFTGNDAPPVATVAAVPAAPLPAPAFLVPPHTAAKRKGADHLAALAAVGAPPALRRRTVGASFDVPLVPTDQPLPFDVTPSALAAAAPWSFAPLDAGIGPRLRPFLQ